jgi:hypothetical protein
MCIITVHSTTVTVTDFRFALDRLDAVNCPFNRGYSVVREIGRFISQHFDMPLSQLEHKLDACGGAIAGPFTLKLLQLCLQP